MKDHIEALAKYLIMSQWSYVAYALPFFIGMIWFYFKHKNRIFHNFAGFIQWLRPSFETGGYASAEKCTAAVVMVVYVISSLIYIVQCTDSLHKLYSLIVHAVFILVLFRIITPQQLQELKDGIKPSQSNQPTQ